MTARVITTIVLILLLLTALYVILFLPGQVAERRVAEEVEPVVQTTEAEPAASEPPAAEEPKTEPVEPPKEVDTKAKGEAERLLGKVLARQAALEAADAAVWGGKEFESAVAAVAAGDDQFAAGRYPEAVKSWEGALTQFDALEESRPERLKEALEQGANALERFDGTEAERQFTIALAIEPGSAEARRGLKRAETIEEAARHYNSGQALEGGGKLEEAAKAYRKAVELDADFSQAKKALAGVENRLAERRFRSAMSSALKALDRRDFKAAQAGLEKARKLRPNASEVKDLAARAKSEMALAKLAKLRRQAEGFAQAEAWEKAGAKYKEVLAIDPNIAFAKAGLEKSRRWLSLNRTLDGFLNSPERLNSHDPMAAARRLVEQADGLPGQGALYSGKLTTLKALIAAASEPAPVLLRSDNETEVTLYRFGTLGRFQRKEINLRPGRYIALGIRRGYRDVRVEIRVETGRTNGPFEISCTERI